jgi:hypothetical protein
MFINSRLNLFLLMPLLCTPQILARQNHSAARPGDRIYLDVVVSPTSGPPVSGLEQQDFTVLDNNVPQTLTSFGCRRAAGSHSGLHTDEIRQGSSVLI